jgi:hypothetical protein
MDEFAQNRWNDPVATSLLAVGWDDGDPNLLAAGPDGKCSLDTIGFAAIGSGSPHAMALLQLHEGFHRSDNLGEIVYWMHAAKFAAENSAFVGPRSTITTVYHAGGRIWMDYGAAASREHFNTERSKRLPTELTALIENSFQKGFVRNTPRRRADPEDSTPSE